MVSFRSPEVKVISAPPPPPGVVVAGLDTEEETDVAVVSTGREDKEVAVVADVVAPEEHKCSFCCLY